MTDDEFEEFKRQLEDQGGMPQSLADARVLAAVSGIQCCFQSRIARRMDEGRLPFDSPEDLMEFSAMTTLVAAAVELGDFPACRAILYHIGCDAMVDDAPPSHPLHSMAGLGRLEESMRHELARDGEDPEESEAVQRIREAIPYFLAD
jgi:hypothetical protein